MAVTIADLIVNLRANTAQYQAGMAQAQATSVRFSKAATGLVAGLKVAVPLAAAAAGAASVKMAYDFDQSFTRIRSLSNASAKDLEQWRGQVLQLAGDTAQAPTELADALFFLSSAGLKAGEIMPALEVSAKAAAVGLGETADVANIVSSALNAYANQGLTAAKVTDTLVAAVREGRAEPEEFANALGRILPIASAAGIEFDEVSASLATLSNIGLDVNEGVTAMRGALQALVAPGSQAADAMAQLGISTDEMRQALAEGGIVFAFQELEKAAGGNIDVLKKIIPNTRALNGLLGVTGQEATKVEATFNAVANATGSLNEAMQETAESDAFKVNKALNDLKVQGTELGGSVLPLLADGMTGVASALTPLADGLGDVSDILNGEFALGFDAMTKRVSLAAKIFGPFNPALKAAGEALDAWNAAEQTGASVTNATNSALEARNGVMDAYIAGTTSATTATNQLTTATRGLKAAQDLLAGGALGVVAAIDDVTEAQREINRLRRQGKTNTEAFRDAELDLLTAQLGLRQAAKDLAKDMKESGASAKDVRRALVNLGREAGLTKKEARELANQIQNVTDKAKGVPPRVKTKVTADTSQAREALNTLLGMLRNLEGGAAIALRGRIYMPRVPEAATGGHVARTGLAVIHRGEDIIPDGGGGFRRISVNLGRERFARQMAYDHDYRGW